MRASESIEANIHSLIYFSRARVDASIDPMLLLENILAQSQGRNKQAKITGALLSCGGWFLQALEGNPVAVLETYQRICNDTRHHSPRILWEGPTLARQFPRWTMCGRHFDSRDAAIVSVLESRGNFQPGRLTPAQAEGLLGTVQNLQAPQDSHSLDRVDEDSVVYI